MGRPPQILASMTPDNAFLSLHRDPYLAAEPVRLASHKDLAKQLTVIDERNATSGATAHDDRRGSLCATRNSVAHTCVTIGRRTPTIAIACGATATQFRTPRQPTTAAAPFGAHVQTQRWVSGDGGDSGHHLNSIGEPNMCQRRPRAGPPNDTACNPLVVRRLATHTATCVCRAPTAGDRPRLCPRLQRATPPSLRPMAGVCRPSPAARGTRPSRAYLPRCRLVCAGARSTLVPPSSLAAHIWTSPGLGGAGHTACLRCDGPTMPRA